MREDELKIDFEELKREKEENIVRRAEFIDFWAGYIKTHSDEDWSEQQNIIINSQLGKTGMQ